MVAWQTYFANLARSFIVSLPALLTPLILLVCIYKGITTTTEAAAIAVSVGFDPTHFGVLVILNATLGNITPPVGNVLMAVCSLEKPDFIEACKGLIVPIVLLVGVMVILIVAPQITLWLPNLLMG